MDFIKARLWVKLCKIKLKRRFYLNLIGNARDLLSRVDLTFHMKDVRSVPE